MRNAAIPLTIILATGCDWLKPITHCGAGSLCEHLGLRVGERLVMDRFDVDELLWGGSTYIEVVRPRARSRWFTITLAP